MYIFIYTVYIYIYIYYIKFHEALVPLVPVFSNPVMFLLLFEQSVNMHVCTSQAKKTKKDKWSLKHAGTALQVSRCRVGMDENGAGYVLESSSVLESV